MWNSKQNLLTAGLLRRTTPRRRITLLAAWVAVLMLASCGSSNSETISQAVATVTPTSEPAPMTTTPTVSSTTTTVAQTASSTSTPAAQTASAATTTVVPAESTYSVLPQNQTTEGYYVLGQPDAPVVLTHYSDFL